MICSHCGESLADADQFCEACGTPVGSAPAPQLASPAPTDPPATGAPVPPVSGGPPMADPVAAPPAPGGATEADRCSACGEGFDADGFCQNCGKRRPEALDHQETDLGLAAAVTDRGLRHRSNEDAYALVTRNERVAVVVCDGVSTSAFASQVSGLAAQAAMAVLEAGLDAPQQWDQTVRHAVAGAQQAAATLSSAGSQGYQSAPATTIVVALAERGRAVVANVGDSRAYVMDADGRPGLVSTDDSLVAQAIAEGVPAEVAYHAPGAHQITAWLGRDARGLNPHVAEVTLADDAVLILCTDGVWNYAEAPSDLASAGAPLGAVAPLAVARRLVEFGLGAGGADNLTAAVVALPPLPVAPVV